MVLLVGNYAPDRQQSMQRFADMMHRGLTEAGISAELVAPHPFFGRFERFGFTVAKWLGYIDKFVLFPARLRRRAAQASLVHICDHSNAMYAAHAGRAPVLATCHDLLAVRGALGEETDSPASSTGVFLQRWIRRSLRQADVLACDSEATREDAARLITRPDSTKPRLTVVPVGLSFPYRPLDRLEVWSRLSSLPALSPDRPYLLHVGSNLRRKNREAILRIVARVPAQSRPQLVFAGDSLAHGLMEEASRLGLSGQIVNVPGPANELLEALYNGALALLYPSRFEGFGWPIIEAQASGCPVICSDRPPLPEVAGDGAIVCPLEDEEAFARGVMEMLDPARREGWRERGLENARRYTARQMVSRYLELYRSMAPNL